MIYGSPSILSQLFYTLMQVSYHLVMLTLFFECSVLIFSGIFLYHHTFC